MDKYTFLFIKNIPYLYLREGKIVVLRKFFKYDSK